MHEKKERKQHHSKEEVYEHLANLEDSALNNVKQATLSYIDSLRSAVVNYPMSTLDDPEALKSETVYMIKLPESHGCDTVLDKIATLVKCLYNLQPLV